MKNRLKLLAALLIAEGMQFTRAQDMRTTMIGMLLFGAAIAVGGSTVWFGPEAVLNVVALLLGAGLLVGARRRHRAVAV